MLAADVVVVGGGVAGCAAALATARSGAEIALLTKLADPEEAWRRLRVVMWERARLVRSAEGLTKGLAEIRILEAEFGDTDLGRALLVARTVLEGALIDCGSRGCHYRLDAEQEEALADLPGQQRHDPARRAGP